MDRSKGLGASEAAAACGLSKWRTPLALYRQKIGEAPPTEETLPMRVGKALESVVLGEYCRERGVTLRDQQTAFRDPALPWRWVTVDAIDSNGVLVEAKTAGTALGWGAQGTDQVPMDYVLQCQHGMAVTGLALAVIPVLIAGREFKVYEVPRDDALIAAITAREQEFWRCVETRTPPAVVSLADATALWPRDTGKAVTATADVMEAVERLRIVRAEIAQKEADADSLELAIKTCMADAARLETPAGDVLATWTAQTARRFDSAALKAELPTIYEQFRKESTSRVFRLKKEKTA